MHPLRPLFLTPLSPPPRVTATRPRAAAARRIGPRPSSLRPCVLIGMLIAAAGVWCDAVHAQQPRSQVAPARTPVTLCSDPRVAQACKTTCAAACADTDFLASHARFCIGIGAVGGGGARVADDGSCAGLLAAAAPPPVPAPPGADSGGAQRPSPATCDQATRVSERVRCQNDADRPACAASVVDLEERSLLLLNEIDVELNKYGALLTTDWGDISNRDQLCAYSIDSLDEAYNTASKNPQILMVLQTRAEAVQTCQTEWERFVSPPSTGEPSDVLKNNLIRSSREKLETMKPGIERVSKSVRILKNAASAIEGIVRSHIFYCKAPARPQPRSIN